MMIGEPRPAPITTATSSAFGRPALAALGGVDIDHHRGGRGLGRRSDRGLELLRREHFDAIETGDEEVQWDRDRLIARDIAGHDLLTDDDRALEAILFE